MDPNILSRLQKITAEEQAIPDGNTAVDWSLYMRDAGSMIHAQKLLAAMVSSYGPMIPALVTCSTAVTCSDKK